MKNLDDILKLITGNMDPEYKKDLFSMVKEDTEAKDLFKKAKITWALMSSTRKMPDYKVEESYNLLQTRISYKEKTFRLNSYFRYAAVFMMILGGSTLAFYLGKQNSYSPEQRIKFTSVVAANGQISKVILPDSSVVWLNSGSTLTYDNNFSFKNRNLDLSGQAFLEVKKNKDLPLILACGNLSVKVLGTRFDVNAYPEDNMFKVILESGKVELLNSNDKSAMYNLNPGEIAEFDTQSGKTVIKKIESGNFSNWKDGNLIFKDSPMAEVIKSLERKFNIKIEVLNPKVYKSVFNANFKDENLKEILDYIQFSCQISYRLIPGKGTIKAKVILN